MLRRHIARAAAGAVVVAVCLVAIQNPAYADYIECPPNNGPCYIVVEGPGGGGGGGGPGGGGGGGGNSPCIHEQLREVPCHNGYGWFNPTNACYYNQLTLAPDDPGWKGDPADGDMYLRTCYNGASGAWLVDDTVYLQSPPPGYGGIPSVLVLLNRAIAQLPLDLPAVETRPRALGTGAVGLVGLPVWLWVNNRNWGPFTASAEVPGVIGVEATARLTHVRWQMGDGGSVTCTTPGTPYTPDRGDDPSPDCGYKYLRPSREVGGSYRVTATAFWVVDWEGSGLAEGQGDRLPPLERASEVNLQINELQVVVR